MIDTRVIHIWESMFSRMEANIWFLVYRGVLVRGVDLSYHNKESILFTIDPHYGNKKSFNKNPV